jgi:hypothetical protein
MRSFGTALTIAFLAGTTVCRSPAQTTARDAQTVSALEDSVWVAARDHRAQTFASLLAPGYRGVFADGIHDKAKEILTLDTVQMDSYELKELLVRPLGPGLFALTYRASVTGTYKDYNLGGDYWCSTVWEKNGEKWQAVLHTETKAPR